MHIESHSIKLRPGSLLALVLLACRVAVGQIPAAGSPGGINTAFMKLFGDVSAFSARLEIQVLDHSQKEWVRMPVDFATLDTKVRMDINIEQATSQDFPAGTIAAMKQAGMERIVSISRPDKKTTFILYPGKKTYLSKPLAKGESDALEKGLQIEKTPLGKETIDNHPCVKNKVVIRNQQGPVLEAVTWNASDLKDLPVRVETREKDTTVVMRFTKVQFTRPDALQFEVPAGYTQTK